MQTVIRHGENWYLSNRSTTTLDAACTLIDGCQIGVHVAREATSAGHLLTSC